MSADLNVDEMREVFVKTPVGEGWIATFVNEGLADAYAKYMNTPEDENAPLFVVRPV